MPPPTELVRSFLAEQDFPCPGCSYNLRGVEQPVCPECGRAIELTISRPGRSRGYLVFVLLALGWVLCAGIMNGVRAWDTVRREASMGSSFVTFLPSRGLTQTLSTPSRTTTIVVPGSGTTTITTPRFTPSSPTPSTSSTQPPASATTRLQTFSTISGGTTTFNSRGSVTFSSRFVTSTPATTRSWSAVSRGSWIMLGWWSGLALLALVWLAITIIRRARFNADRPPRLLTASAWTLFTLYAGYHALMFSREFLT